MSRAGLEKLKKTLRMNEGFSTSSYYKAGNKEEMRYFEIRGGALKCRRVGILYTSGKLYDDISECNPDETLRFIQLNRRQLTIPETPSKKSSPHEKLWAYIRVHVTERG